MLSEGAMGDPWLRGLLGVALILVGLSLLFQWLLAATVLAPF